MVREVVSMFYDQIYELLRVLHENRQCGLMLNNHRIHTSAEGVFISKLEPGGN
jgi:hypothetical protein